MARDRQWRVTDNGAWQTSMRWALGDPSQVVAGQALGAAGWRSQVPVEAVGQRVGRRPRRRSEPPEPLEVAATERVCRSVVLGGHVADMNGETLPSRGEQQVLDQGHDAWVAGPAARHATHYTHVLCLRRSDRHRRPTRTARLL